MTRKELPLTPLESALTIWLVLVLSAIIGFAFFRANCVIDWNLIVVAVLLWLCIMLSHLEEFEFLRIFKGRTKQATDSAVQPEAKPLVPALQQDKLKVLACNELKHLIQNYTFFWRAWKVSEEECHEVRFSDAFSGRPLRYVNHLKEDMDSHLLAYGSVVSGKVKTSLETLKAYAAELAQYQVDGSQVLREAKFSTRKYVSLMNDLSAKANEECPDV